MATTQGWGTAVSPDKLGLVAFMPTPVRGGQVDREAVQRQLAFLRDSEISVGVLGGIGEFYALSLSESLEVIGAAVEGSQSAVPVLAGIGFATREAVRLAVGAAREGADGLVINPPYYVHPTPKAFAEHVRAVTEASGLSAVVYSSEFLSVDDRYLELLIDVPGFIGVKEETVTADEFHRRVRSWGDRLVWWTVGERGSREFVKAGAGVVTSSLANISPTLSHACLRAVMDDAADLPPFMEKWNVARRAEPGAEIAVLKHMLSVLRGWPVEVRAPNTPASSDAQREAGRFVEELRSEGWCA